VLLDTFEDTPGQSRPHYGKVAQLVRARHS
jgi:hypothetical protein